MSEKPFKFPHCVFPSSPSSFCRVEIKNRTSGFNCSICFGKETYPDLASDQKNASKRVIFFVTLWFCFAYCSYAIWFCAVRHHAFKLAVWEFYTNQIWSFCVLPTGSFERADRYFFLLLTVYSAFFFSNELCATLALTFFLDGCSFPKFCWVVLGFKCCMKITKQLCTSYKVFKGVENSEHCRTI